MEGDLKLSTAYIIMALALAGDKQSIRCDGEGFRAVNFEPASLGNLNLEGADLRIPERLEGIGAFGACLDTECRAAEDFDPPIGRHPGH